MKNLNVRRIVSITSILLVTGAGTGLAQAVPAAATTASCTDASVTSDVFGAEVLTPSVGHLTGNFNCILGLGNDSVAVSLLQGNLNVCYGDHLVQDGQYGPATEAAVAAVQRAIPGMPVDGIFGPHTRGFMRWLEIDGTGRCGALGTPA